MIKKPFINTFSLLSFFLFYEHTVKWLEEHIPKVAYSGVVGGRETV